MIFTFHSSEGKIVIKVSQIKLLWLSVHLVARLVRVATSVSIGLESNPFFLPVTWGSLVPFELKSSWHRCSFNVATPRLGSINLI